MLKDATYKDKFARLSQWLPVILEAIKKDLRTEHLMKDPVFVRQYFAGKNPSKLSIDELAKGYSQHLANGENAEDLGEFISNRWLLKHTELYQYFEQELSKINPNFHELDVLDHKTATPLMEGAVAQFGAPNTYMFCILNSVVFPDDIYKALKQRAEEVVHKAHTESQARQELQSLEAMQRNYEQQLARQADKYEKKLLGLQKKYVIDTESLKKQVSTLQRKLNT